MTAIRTTGKKIPMKINKNKSGTLFIIVLFAILSSGIWYMYTTWYASIDEKADQIMKLGMAMETAINGETVNELTGTPEDEGTPAYELIKDSLMKERSLYEYIRFFYMYTVKDGIVTILVDSEPKESKDYSPPGQIYTEASDQNKQAFEDGKPIITTPNTDRWGTWVSVLVPMKDHQTGEVKAVFAMDYPAATFNHEAKENTIQVGVMVLFALMVLFAYYLIFTKNRTLKKEKEMAWESEENYRSIFEHTPLGVLRFNEQGIITECNENFVKIIGSSFAALIGFDINSIPDENMNRALKQVLSGEIATYEGDYHSVTANKVTPVRGTYAPIFSEDKKIKGGVGIFEDITQRKNLETDLVREKNLLEITLTSIGDGVISTDIEGNIVFLNREAEKLTGWNQEEAYLKPVELVFNLLEEDTGRTVENPVRKVLETGQTFELGSHTLLVTKDNLKRPIEDSVSPIRDENGNISGAVLVFRDFSEKKQKQQEIENLSFRDQLTGMYNRRFYEKELGRLDIGSNMPLTVVMGDVNGLKLINDSFGHAMGDALLKKAAESIKSCCRSDDIISRIGGDEFIILLPKTYKAETEQIIKRIHKILEKEKIGAIDISISFGYETKYTESENIGEVLKKAEDSMYNSKLYESPSMRGKTVEAIIKNLYEKNAREEEHSRRVSTLCEKMGIALELSENKIKGLRTVGLLHDIGKIAIDEGLLNKPGRLNEEEFKEIKRHPEIGYRILSMVNEMSEIAEYVLSHHERWDGNGYPKGLKEKEIPFVSRIIGIADAYDAMTSDRSYRDAMTREQAADELIRNAGAQFDPELTAMFIEKVLEQEENNNVAQADQKSSVVSRPE